LFVIFTVQALSAMQH